MRVCIEKATGKLIESQSGGRTHPNPDIDDTEYAQTNLNVLLQNAVNAGHRLEDIEAKFIPNEDLPALIEASKSAEQKLEEANAPIEANLKKIDLKSIRAIREILAKMSDLPTWIDKDGKTVSLADIDSVAIAERTKLEK